MKALLIDAAGPDDCRTAAAADALHAELLSAGYEVDPSRYASSTSARARGASAAGRVAPGSV